MWAGLDVIIQKRAKLSFFANSELNISSRPHGHTTFLIELSYLDPKQSQIIKKLVCTCGQGEKMRSEDGFF